MSNKVTPETNADVEKKKILSRFPTYFLYPVFLATLMSNFEAHSDAPKHRGPVAIKVATKSAFESGHKKSQKKGKEKGAKKSGSYLC